MQWSSEGLELEEGEECFFWDERRGAGRDGKEQVLGQAYFHPAFIFTPHPQHPLTFLFARRG